MALYQDWVVPVLIDLSMRNKRLRPYRERVAGAAEGRVLEVGIGSGLNLPFFGRRAREIFGLDPSSHLLARARDQTQHAHVQVHLLEGSAECIPLGDRSMDSVVMTWTGCSIPDVRAALREMRRVLSPGGRLLFVEYGRAPEPGLAGWQELLDPLWLRLSGGCHLSRKIDDLLSDEGFRISSPPRLPAPGRIALPALAASERAWVLQALRASDQEVFNLDEGPVTLTFPESLSSASYEDLKDYFDLFLRKAKRRADAEDEIKKLIER